MGCSDVSMADRTRLLCISPYFPPLVNAEATCSGKLINELAAAGVDVTVLTVAYGQHHEGAAYDRSLLWHPLQSVTVPIPPHGNQAKWLSAILASRYQVSSWPRWLHEILRVATDMHTQEPFQVIYSRS